MKLISQTEHIQVWEYSSPKRRGGVNRYKKYRYIDPDGIDRGYLSKQQISLSPRLKQPTILNCGFCQTLFTSLANNAKCCSKKCLRLLNESAIKCSNCAIDISALSKHGKCHPCLLKKQSLYRAYKSSPIDRKISRGIRSLISQSFKVKELKKKSKTLLLLSCSITQLKVHLESKFQPGMTWANWGMGSNKWQVDHICPCSQAKNEEELIKLQHYTNLQPLWARDNIMKSNDPTPLGIDLCISLLNREWIS